MKILFICDNFFPEVNAQASRVYERARYWVSAGHQVTILTCAPNFPQGKVYRGYKNKWYQTEMLGGIKVVRIKSYIAANQGTLRRIIDYLSFMFSASFFGLWQKKADVIVVTSPQFFAAIAGFWLAFSKRKPFILEISDLWPQSITAVGAMKPSFGLRCLEKIELFLYRRARAIICLTESIKQDINKRGIDNHKLTVINNGVDLKQFQTLAEPCQQLLEQYQLHNKFIIGYLGTHGLAHGLENVLDAAAALQHHSDIVFLFVGDGAKRQALMNLANKKALTNVIFAGPQKKSDMPAYWSLCDLALISLQNLPLFKGALPSKMFEAMAMAIPLLLFSPEGEASDLIAQEKTGTWVDAAKPNLLSETILKLQQDQQTLSQFKANCLKHAPKHSRQQQADECLCVFEKVLKKSLS